MPEVTNGDGRVVKFFETYDWTRFTYAKDRNNESIDVMAEEAVAFCLVGAIRRCYGREVGSIIESTIEQEMHEELVVWNDTRDRTKAQVIALCEEWNI